MTDQNSPCPLKLIWLLSCYFSPSISLVMLRFSLRFFGPLYAMHTGSPRKSCPVRYEHIHIHLIIKSLCKLFFLSLPSETLTYFFALLVNEFVFCSRSNRSQMGNFIHILVEVAIRCMYKARTHQIFIIARNYDFILRMLPKCCFVLPTCHHLKLALHPQSSSSIFHVQIRVTKAIP